METSRTPTASDIMNPHVHTIGPELGLADIVKFLVSHDISNAPVVQQEGARRILMGFVSEGDCLEFLGNELFYGNPSPPQTAETIMKRHPVCISPETDMFTITSILTNHRFRHLPVVQDQELLGIVSRHDILKSLDKYYHERDNSQDRKRVPVDLHKIMNHRFIVTGHS